MSILSLQQTAAARAGCPSSTVQRAAAAAEGAGARLAVTVAVAARAIYRGAAPGRAPAQKLSDRSFPEALDPLLGLGADVAFPGLPGSS